LTINVTDKRQLWIFIPGVHKLYENLGVTQVPY
jgi:hypothetical protein